MPSQLTQTLLGVLGGIFAGLSLYYGWRLARTDGSATLMSAVQYGMGVVVAGAVYLAPGPFPAWQFALSAAAAASAADVFVRRGSDGTVQAKSGA